MDTGNGPDLGSFGFPRNSAALGHQNRRPHTVQDFAPCAQISWRQSCTRSHRPTAFPVHVRKAHCHRASTPPSLRPRMARRLEVPALFLEGGVVPRRRAQFPIAFPTPQNAQRGQITRCRDGQNLLDAAQHQCGERIVNHRLVVAHCIAVRWRAPSALGAAASMISHADSTTLHVGILATGADVVALSRHATAD